ncbi:AarF/UbiB family protein [Paenibacillus sp. EZ-K15]|uniref:AarF/UbiB family protein n=1 Tax=Paenibacillus sp. EZ-K15 TaxID=2044275 RepID=UPI000BF5BE68|nr:AarF/UbiB family protein [Paenibacillus sp. EZ-K15]
MSQLVTTDHFNSLDEDIKYYCSKIYSNDISNEEEFLSVLSRINVTNLIPLRDVNRGFISEIVGHDLVIKKFNDKGKYDSDIIALNSLQNLNCIPRIYCYREKSFLVMEKAKGISLIDIVEYKIEVDHNQIISSYKNAYLQVLNRGWQDFDLKLEHIYWDITSERIMFIDFGQYGKLEKSNLYIENALNVGISKVMCDFNLS